MCVSGAQASWCGLLFHERQALCACVAEEGERRRGEEACALRETLCEPCFSGFVVLAGLGLPRALLQMVRAFHFSSPVACLLDSCSRSL